MGSECYLFEWRSKCLIKRVERHTMKYIYFILMIIFFIKLVLSQECNHRLIQSTSIDVNTFNFQD